MAVGHLNFKLKNHVSTTFWSFYLIKIKTFNNEHFTLILNSIKINENIFHIVKVYL